MMRGMKGSRDCMICAAQLAAFYSDERSEDLVEVGYTDSRHVARANAARAGRMRDSKRLNAIAVRPADAAATVASHAAGLSLAEDLRSSGQEATMSPVPHSAVHVSPVPTQKSGRWVRHRSGAAQRVSSAWSKWRSIRCASALRRQVSIGEEAGEPRKPRGTDGIAGTRAACSKT
jgi:hypothetical protein